MPYLEFTIFTYASTSSAASRVAVLRVSSICQNDATSLCITVACLMTESEAKNMFSPACPVLFFLIMSLALLIPANGEEFMREESEEEVETEPSIAVLFPWFAEILGVLVFFFMTRYFRLLPFTAIMFLLGTFMGIGARRLSNENLLTESISQWEKINSEVLLLVFLPGLIFRDAFTLNVRLFSLAINQILLLAFIMVLAGTCLTALVGFYILPYGWSWSLCMTLGSILAATDPVAVSSLLDEVGAPPRLKIQISGESLLNDGSSYVFFVIFSSLFLAQIGIPGLGAEIGTAQGFAIFFRMALGGTALGLAFGLGLTLILFCLNRRLNVEENVMQVIASITFAYLAYYSADSAYMSGVIATLACGISAQAFGSTLINDLEMMNSFWILVEKLLNILLFTLAGTVWGGLIGDAAGSTWGATEWGYMVLVYVLVNVIRFFLVGAFYPIFSRIGLKSSWQEATFLSYAGLRGGVGIALALSLNNGVRQASEISEEADAYAVETTRVFGIVGGIALLTLVVNGTSSGPVLKKLGLAKSKHFREKVLKDLERNIRQHMMDEFVKLLSEHRFNDVDFSVVKFHVPWLQDMTLDELRAAVERNKHTATPNLVNVLPYFDIENDSDLSWAKCPADTKNQRRRSTILGRDKSLLELNKKLEMDTFQLRQFFVGILQCSYGKMTEHGELDGRDPFVTLVLLDGLDFAATEVDKGMPLKDWEATESVKKEGPAQIVKRFWNKHNHPFRESKRSDTVEHQRLRINVHRAQAFIHAHRLCLEHFEDYIASSNTSAELKESEQIVVSEIKEQMQLAQKSIEDTNEDDMEVFESHSMCSILLNRTAVYIESLLSAGLLEEREANGLLEEIGDSLEKTHHCVEQMHPGHLSRDEKSKHLSLAENRTSANLSDTGHSDDGDAQ